jgi:hypothetical protein
MYASEAGPVTAAMPNSTTPPAEKTDQALPRPAALIEPGCRRIRVTVPRDLPQGRITANRMPSSIR